MLIQVSDAPSIAGFDAAIATKRTPAAKVSKKDQIDTR
jgi:hypothetical protein